MAENVTQKAMHPIDEFEAFARMMEVGGHDPNAIAGMFGVERSRVLDRLRYGRIHPEIRAAARAKDISLDVMKAYAGNPDQDIQKLVFDGIREENVYPSAHVVRKRLEERGTRIGDALGQMVVDAYRQAGGDIAADLIDEDSVLMDRELVDQCLIEVLQSRAEEERARLGFAWADVRTAMDYDEIHKFGRVYSGEITPEGDAVEEANALADRMAKIDEELESEEATDVEALEAEWSQLERDYDALTKGFAPEHLERAGVIAVWERGDVKLLTGLIRPEDEASGKKITNAAGAAGDENSEEDAGPGPLVLSDSLKADLRTERAIVVGSVLAADPDLAQDLVLFKLATDVLGGYTPTSYALGLGGSAGERPHGKREAMDPRPGTTLEALQTDLDLAWWDEKLPMETRFEQYRALDSAMKARITAVVLAHALKPTSYGFGERLLSHVASRLVPDLRAVWRPTGEAFFGRLKVAGLILSNWLAGRTRAIWLSKSKTLIEDAVRDWTDLGGAPTDILPIDRWKPDEAITLSRGILFLTYATLRAVGKTGRSRLEQIADWAGGDFEGVLAFDEAHAMQNAGGSNERRGSAPSQQGIAGLRLQLALPRARVLYVSATGATHVSNLAYATRLGLWGPGAGYPFASREDFVSAMEAGGVAAMEVVARDLKALGLYTARALSFEGVEYDILDHRLSDDERTIYDAFAGAFRIIHHNLRAALEATGITDAESGQTASAAKASALSRFESMKQRFFGHILNGFKAKSLIAAIEGDLADGQPRSAIAITRATKALRSQIID